MASLTSVDVVSACVRMHEVKWIEPRLIGERVRISIKANEELASVPFINGREGALLNRHLRSATHK
jgi:hypothetical protein